MAFTSFASERRCRAQVLPLAARLTFELTWSQRRDAKPALQTMRACAVARALWHAVGAQVERGVRPHFLRSQE
jgi:hypothetical protein